MEMPKNSTYLDDQAYIEVGDMVELLNVELNSGRGISAIRDVASALKRGYVESAKATINNEWDKISTHKEVADYLIAQGLYVPINWNEINTENAVD